MIQRPQTVFLTLALILLVVSCSLNLAVFSSDNLGEAPLYMNMLCFSANGQVENYRCSSLLVLVSVSVIFTVLAIFGYKNYNKQIRFCNFAMVAELLWAANFAAIAFTLDDFTTFTPGIGASFPLIALVLTFVSRWLIKKDRKFLRDCERIR